MSPDAHVNSLSTRQPGQISQFLLPGGLKMTFCWIPPGTAQLGSPVEERRAVAEQLGQPEDWLATESDTNRGMYASRGFWLTKYPVMQAEWHAIMGENPSYFHSGGGGAAKVSGLETHRFPVERVSWEMICGTGGFLEKMEVLTGREEAFGQAGMFALPHENEWEYACRGGVGNQRVFYWGNELDGTQANMNGNFPFGTATVGQFLERPTQVGSYELIAPHPWDLCDMHGNVWEWCENLYEHTGYPVRRGGSWDYIGHYCRAADRYWFKPDHRHANVGLRLCYRCLD